MVSTRRRIGFLLACSTLWASAAWAAVDQVTTAARKVLRGTILADQYDHVVIKTPDGKKVTIPTADVKNLRYGQRSMNYLNASNLFRQGRYAEALPKFEAALKEAGKIKWLGQYATFYKAECLAHLAEKDAKRRPQAVAAYKELVAKFPKSRFLPNAYIGLARVYQAAGQTAQMEAAVKKLDPAKLGKQWTLERRRWEARVLEAKKQYAEAAKQYALLAQEAEKAKDMAAADRALLNQGRCLLLAKQKDKGEDILFRLGARSNDEAIKAAAFNALGDHFWADGNVYEALFAYLRVAVLYLDEPEENAKALYWAAKCFQKRGERGRANELLAELKREHPDSPWAKKK